MLTLLGSIITPAVVASLFSLVFNARAEKRRDARKAILDRLQESRDLVADAVKSAAAYFSKPYAERTPAIEAELWLIEREVRLSLSTLTERTDAQLKKELTSLQRDFDFFVGELTGSNFQQKEAEVDLAHIRKIAGLGADLRLSLSRAHVAELKAALERDPLDRVLKFFEIGEHYVPLADRFDERPDRQTLMFTGAAATPQPPPRSPGSS
jgi:hypothetical protein